MLMQPVKSPIWSPTEPERGGLLKAATPADQTLAHIVAVVRGDHPRRQDERGRWETPWGSGSSVGRHPIRCRCGDGCFRGPPWCALTWKIRRATATGDATVSGAPFLAYLEELIALLQPATSSEVLSALRD